MRQACGIWLLAILALAGMAGCVPDRDATAEYRNLPRDGWKYGDTLQFVLTHPDSIVGGNIVVGVRHCASFPFKTLWLEVVSEEQGMRRCDTLGVELCDRYGRWRGRGVAASFQLTDTLATPIRHRSGAPVKVRHIMRTDTLCGLEQVGVFFEPLHSNG